MNKFTPNTEDSLYETLTKIISDLDKKQSQINSLNKREHELRKDLARNVRTTQRLCITVILFGIAIIISTLGWWLLQ
ncbi:DNA binding protein [Bacillus phage Harambe]|uniref:Uncharacterized protein n=1 Tax=Bacillus phage Harambe TaxID=1981931 RepID=A0A1W6JSA9_9CAUD|nr:DNA binding protein [Bacillus phage Harambe]ARM70159.1 hypothetical protein HARAMBE_10 [Bacillus phage Harambe]